MRRGSTVRFEGMNNSSHGRGYDIMVDDLIIPACFPEQVIETLASTWLSAPGRLTAILDP
jgi:hypothetical protein